jgi:glycosyltransferase involved in cell wall biosynthesis
MLTTFYPPYNFGGDGIAIRRLSQAFAARGHAVTVIHDEDAYLTAARKDPAPIAADPGVEVIGLRSRWSVGANLLTHQLGRPVTHGARIARLLDEGRYDVIWHNNASLVGGPGLLSYGKALKVYEAHEHWLVCPTHVLWRHGREVCDKRECFKCQLSYRRPPQLWRHTGLLGRELRHVDAFIAKSAFSRDKHKEFGFPREMTVIPYFLPDEPPAEGAPPHDKPYFLFVGRLEKIKGVQDVLPSFAGEDGPDLIIIGAGEYEAELRAQAEGMPRVKFTGRLPPEALAAYYRHARALIVPSVCFETFGIILIESFRNGTPVIARRIGPFPEIVEQSQGGVLFSDEAELRAAIARLGADIDYRESLAKRARHAFETNWREDVVMARYLDLLRGMALARDDRKILTALGT